MLTETGGTITDGTGKMTISANFDSNLTGTPVLTMKYKVVLHEDNVITPL